ncbi:MAG TPA: hypothetical protein VFH73_08420 [Polyangia bacterium]|jgi:hypothetical protein|nr:hypothetical protein [Polyangia bacterium]
MARRCPALLVTSLGGLLGFSVGRTARAEDNERYVLRAELGVEYDTNAHRTEHLNDTSNPENVRSPLGRAVASASVSDVIAPGHAVALSATAAGKLFADQRARDEDVAVAQSSAEWRMNLGSRASLGLAGNYYEAFQRPEADGTVGTQQRDFRSLTSALRLGRLLGNHVDFALATGYRLFVFKPDQNFNFRAPLASLDLRWSAESADGGAEWDLGVGGSFELRAFEGTRLVNACVPPSSIGMTCPPVAAAGDRRDYFGLGHLELTRTGRVLLGAGYALHWNQSNSFGESVLRHLVVARFALGLPLGLYLASRGELLIARYRDPVIVGQLTTGGKMFVSIDDENRSGLRVDLSRAVTDGIQVIARYTLYVNELGNTRGRFVRHTSLLSVAFSLEK